MFTTELFKFAWEKEMGSGSPRSSKSQCHRVDFGWKIDSQTIENTLISPVNRNSLLRQVGPNPNITLRSFQALQLVAEIPIECVKLKFVNIYRSLMIIIQEVRNSELLFCYFDFRTDFHLASFCCTYILNRQPTWYLSTRHSLCQCWKWVGRVGLRYK